MERRKEEREEGRKGILMKKQNSSKEKLHESHQSPWPHMQGAHTALAMNASGGLAGAEAGTRREGGEEEQGQGMAGDGWMQREGWVPPEGRYVMETERRGSS